MENKNENNTVQPTYKAGDKYEIPVEGSLGLLALGHTGLKLWRAKRAEVAAAKKASQEKTNTENTTK